MDRASTAIDRTCTYVLALGRSPRLASWPGLGPAGWQARMRTQHRMPACPCTLARRASAVRGLPAEYRTVAGVAGPLVVVEFVKVRTRVG